MGVSLIRAKYETQLDRAHRSLYWAGMHATEMGDEGAAEDCASILREITRLVEDSLAQKRRKPRSSESPDKRA